MKRKAINKLLSFRNTSLANRIKPHKFNKMNNIQFFESELKKRKNYLKNSLFSPKEFILFL